MRWSLLGRVAVRHVTALLACLGATAVGAPPVRFGEPPRLHAPVPRLPRDDLLVYRGPDQQPAPVQNRDDWFKRRAEILDGMAAVMGPLPGPEKRCPLDVRVGENV